MSEFQQLPKFVINQMLRTVAQQRERARRLLEKADALEATVQRFKNGETADAQPVEPPDESF